MEYSDYYIIELYSNQLASLQTDGTNKVTVRYNLSDVITYSDIPYEDGTVDIDFNQPVFLKISYDEDVNEYVFAISQDNVTWKEHIVESSQKISMDYSTRLYLFNGNSFYENNPLKLYLNDTYFKVNDEYIFKCS